MDRGKSWLRAEIDLSEKGGELARSRMWGLICLLVGVLTLVLSDL